MDCASGRVVSSNCHSTAVANIDFKLCRSQNDSHSAQRKVESSSSEAKIFRIGAEKKCFQADQKGEHMDYRSLRWRGKSSNGSEFRRENGLAVQVFQNGSV